MKILGFILRLLIVVALVVWLADRPGTAQIVWRDTVIETSAAVLGVIVLFLVYAVLQAHRLWRFLWDGPRFWRLNRRLEKLDEGQTELTKGMSALAAGLPADAGRHAVRARKLLGETPATRLLQAQAAQLSGDTQTARALFEALTADPDGAMLGYRGLMMSAWRSGDMDEVSRLISRIEQTNKDVPWLHLVRFQMGVRIENWTQAEKALEKARRGHALPRTEADRFEAALLLAEAKNALRGSEGEKALACAEKAKKLAPDWMPAYLILAEAQIVTRHERTALRTLEKAWAMQPHPQLVPLAHWALNSAKPIDGYKLIERMTRDSRSSPASLLALADAALKADLWGEARKALMSLVQRGEASQLAYQMLARLERRETGSEKAAMGWLSKATVAPPDPQWLCGNCGASHEYWEATCPSCGAFNKMIWGIPGQAYAGQTGAARLSITDVWAS